MQNEFVAQCYAESLLVLVKSKFSPYFGKCVSILFNVFHFSSLPFIVKKV